MDALGEKPPYLRDIPLAQLLDAKIHTADFLASIGFPASDAQIEADAARSVFATLTDPDLTEIAKKQSVALLETPESVRHLVAMLTAYDWQWIEHATEIRNYLVSQLLEATQHPDPKVYMKAIELAGKIKEVGLFEERVVQRRENVSDEELEAKIREKMAKLRALERPKEEPVDAVFTEKRVERA